MSRIPASFFYEEGRIIICNEERIKLRNKTAHLGLIPNVVPFA